MKLEGDALQNSEPSPTPKNNYAVIGEESPIWRIKYRPDNLMALKTIRPKIYSQFQGYINAHNIPHIMLVGPDGAGKTLLAELLAKELLGTEFQYNYKILFADDPIGKKERDEAKRQGRVSTTKVGSSAGGQRNYRPFIQMRVRPFVSTRKFGDAPFKILVIKNFHKLDVEQQAFRRIMEQYSSNCRMILITDKISGIIDPIVSRCQLVLVPHIKTPFFNKVLKTVCDQEKIPINLDVLNYVQKMTLGNLGKALDLIQLTFLQFKFLTLEYLTKMHSEMSSKSIETLFLNTIEGNFNTIRKTLRSIFQTQNLSKDEILLGLSRVVTKLPLERKIRAYYLNLIAETDFNCLDSNDDEIQLNQLLSKMMLLGPIVKKS